ncbi:hypothetical protein GCM10009534_50730 [Kribbella sandramycini]|uniref:Uncharacterized protein n=1 Tax=Kribbella sandramycini TaxID=60450 RepID=A0A841SP12_9ACTN|nr:hypothetical protein [Kribbella sandramycini]
MNANEHRHPSYADDHVSDAAPTAERVVADDYAKAHPARMTTRHPKRRPR